MTNKFTAKVVTLRKRTCLALDRWKWLSFSQSLTVRGGILGRMTTKTDKNLIWELTTWWFNILIINYFETYLLKGNILIQKINLPFFRISKRQAFYGA